VTAEKNLLWEDAQQVICTGQARHEARNSPSIFWANPKSANASGAVGGVRFESNISAVTNCPCNPPPFI